jgi:hypothetical protein
VNRGSFFGGVLLLPPAALLSAVPGGHFAEAREVVVPFGTPVDTLSGEFADGDICLENDLLIYAKSNASVSTRKFLEKRTFWSRANLADSRHSAIVSTKGRLYVATPGVGVVAIDLRSAMTVWRSLDLPPIRGFFLSDELYVWGRGFAAKLRLVDGVLLWRKSFGDAFVGPMVGAGRTVAINVTPPSEPPISTSVAILDARTGEVRFEIPEIWNQVANANVIGRVGGNIYIATTNATGTIDIGNRALRLASIRGSDGVIIRMDDYRPSAPALSPDTAVPHAVVVSQDLTAFGLGNATFAYENTISQGREQPTELQRGLPILVESQTLWLLATTGLSSFRVSSAGVVPVDTYPFSINLMQPRSWLISDSIVAAATTGGNIVVVNTRRRRSKRYRLGDCRTILSASAFGEYVAILCGDAQFSGIHIIVVRI